MLSNLNLEYETDLAIALVICYTENMYSSVVQGNHVHVHICTCPKKRGLSWAFFAPSLAIPFSPFAHS
jgi:hypothetical protein